MSSCATIIHLPKQARLIKLWAQNAQICAHSDAIY